MYLYYTCTHDAKNSSTVRCMYYSIKIYIYTTVLVVSGYKQGVYVTFFFTDSYAIFTSDSDIPIYSNTSL